MKEKKLIFLDIDGVFNSERWYKKRHVMPEYQQYLEDMRKEYALAEKEGRKVIPENYKDTENWEFDPLCVEQFNRIIDETGAEIVVSSTWRKDPNIVQILKDAGLKGKVVGTTPCIWWKDLKTDVDILSQDLCSIPRGLEIKQWLEKHYNYRNPTKVTYVIIDDDGDMLLQQKENFVQTSWYSGLQKRHADETIKILNKTGETK